MSDWCRENASGKVLLSLHIQPGAKKTEVAGIHGEALKIRLAAPPVDGKANEALIRFLALCLEIPRAAITIKSGQTSRQKQLELSNIRLSEVMAALLPPLP